MPIQVSCHCGASFAAKDELAGQTLLCPKCHQPLTIGAEQQAKAQRSGGMSDLFDEAGLQEVKGPRCPNCGEGVQQGSILCVTCGYNLQTGEKVEGAAIKKRAGSGHSEAADALLDRAARRIADDKAEEKKTRKQGAPAYIYLVALLGLIGFATTMFVLPRERAFLISGYCVAGFGGLMSAYYGIRMIIVAFMESTVCGLMYLFVPFYALYYIFTRWDQVGGMFLLQIVGSFVYSLGIGMVVLAPMMKGEEESAARFPIPEAAVVSTWPEQTHRYRLDPS